MGARKKSGIGAWKSPQPPLTKGGWGDFPGREPIASYSTFITPCITRQCPGKVQTYG
jgi:hypothetical protein